MHYGCYIAYKIENLNQYTYTAVPETATYQAGEIGFFYCKKPFLAHAYWPTLIACTNFDLRVLIVTAFMRRA